MSLHPCSGPQGPSSTRNHHRLFRSLPQINSPRANAHLPPIADQEPTDSSLPSAAVTSTHFSIPRCPPPSFSSPSCYMLPKNEPWETCPPFAKFRPPPKISRLDLGSARLMRDCVYELPPLCIRRPPEATFDPAEPVGEAVGLSLLEEASGLVAQTQPGAPFGELPDPLTLDVSNQPDGGRRSFEVAAQHQLPLSPSPLSTWTLGTSDTVTSRADGTQLGTSFHINTPSPLPTSTSLSSSTRPLPQPFDSTVSCLQPNLQAHSSAQVRSGSTSPHPTAMSSALHAVKVESPGKRPEFISKREARSITKMPNQASKEPLGSLKSSELLASLSTRTPDGSSRDSIGESVGLALSLPPSTASGQRGLGSRLPSISTNRLLQNDLIRQMSPLHRTSASYMVSTDKHQFLPIRFNIWKCFCFSKYVVFKVLASQQILHSISLISTEK